MCFSTKNTIKTSHNKNVNKKTTVTMSSNTEIWLINDYHTCKINIIYKESAHYKFLKIFFKWCSICSFF